MGKEEIKEGVFIIASACLLVPYRTQMYVYERFAFLQNIDNQ
jgi:hypothetical protein